MLVGLFEDFSPDLKEFLEQEVKWFGDILVALGRKDQSYQGLDETRWA